MNLRFSWFFSRSKAVSWAHSYLSIPRFTIGFFFDFFQSGEGEILSFPLDGDKVLQMPHFGDFQIVMVSTLDDIQAGASFPHLQEPSNTYVKFSAFISKFREPRSLYCRP